MGAQKWRTARSTMKCQIAQRKIGGRYTRVVFGLGDVEDDRERPLSMRSEGFGCITGERLGVCSLVLDPDVTSSDTSSDIVLLRFKGGGADPSGGRFLHERCRVPGLLSGPRRFGTASYWHSFNLRTQLLQTGRVESQRIFRARLRNVRSYIVDCSGRLTIDGKL
jgi:hypothetical protein